MGYQHISNLYRAQDILMFKKCWALEKIHGSSSNISYLKATDDVTFFSGGESHQRFVELFDKDALLAKFREMGVDSVVVNGEVYGGKCQGMSNTYGKELRFIAFDVRIDDVWLSVPNMAQVVTNLGLEVVPYEETETDLEKLDALRDRPSEVAIRRGMGNDRPREGVVLRPLIELIKNNGERIIVKHKAEAHSERATPQKVVDAAKLKILSDAEAVAAEWVVHERLTHVIDHLVAKGIPCDDMKHVPDVIKEMIEDVYREAKGEIVESKDVKSAIGKKAAQLFKARIMSNFKENHG